MAVYVVEERLVEGLGQQQPSMRLGAAEELRIEPVDGVEEAGAAEVAYYERARITRLRPVIM